MPRPENQRFDSIAKWIENGKRKQKRCKTPALARRHEETQRLRIRERQIFETARNEALAEYSASKTETELEEKISDAINRSDGRSLDLGHGGWVTSLGAEAALQLVTDEAEADFAPTEGPTLESEVARLQKVYARTLAKALMIDGKKTGWSEEEIHAAERAAQIQYKASLPLLRPGDGAKTYAACVAAGIALGVFQGREGNQLLYAAQICMGGAAGKKRA